VTVEIDMRGRIAVVTAGGSGIGRAISLLLGEAGATVVVADIDRDAAQRVADEAAGAGAAASAVELDVTDWDGCLRAARSADDVGPVDILVNGAGVWTAGPFDTLEPRDWADDLDVGLQGTLQVTRAMLPGMKERRRGVIVNISSDVGRVGAAGYVVYSSAKAGVIGFTKALAREVGRYGVRVNCVSPGTVRTPGSIEAIAAGPEERLAKMFPLGRIGEPLDVASAVLFLASDLSAWITGQVLSVSGGATTAG